MIAKIFKKFSLTSGMILPILSPLVLFSQQLNEKPIQNISFDFDDLAKNLNFHKFANTANRDIKIGVMLYNSTKNQNQLLLENLQKIFNYFVSSPKIITTNFSSEQSWVEGLEMLHNQNVELILHLYPLNLDFLLKKIKIKNTTFDFSEILNFYSNTDGVVHFFDADNPVGKSVFTQLSILAKTDDKQRQKHSPLTITKTIDSQGSGLIAPHFVIPKLKYKIENQFRSAKIEYYPAIVSGALFSQLLANYSSLQNSKTNNQNIWAALSLNSSNSDNQNFSFNGMHVAEGFGYINYDKSLRFLSGLEPNSERISQDYNESKTFSMFNMSKGDKLSALLFFAPKNYKEIFDNTPEIIKEKPTTGWQNIWNRLQFWKPWFQNKSKAINQTKEEQVLNNDFNIYLEVLKGSWQVLMVADSQLTNFDKINFQAFEDGVYRLRVESKNFNSNLNYKYNVFWTIDKLNVDA